MPTLPRQFKVVTAEQKKREARNRMLQRVALCAGLLLALYGAGRWLVAPWTMSAKAPAQWPKASQLVRSFVSPTMILFVEPKQTEAAQNLDELDWLVKHNRLAAYVVFKGEQPEANLLLKARKLPNTTVFFDRQKREAEKFKVSSAGDCLLFDDRGQLQFHGEIATSRAEAERNARFLLSADPVAPATTAKQAAAAAQ